MRPADNVYQEQKSMSPYCGVTGNFSLQLKPPEWYMKVWVGGGAETGELHITALFFQFF